MCGIVRYKNVAKKFAGGGLNKAPKDNVLSTRIPEKNVFNKKKILEDSDDFLT